MNRCTAYHRRAAHGQSCRGRYTDAYRKKEIYQVKNRYKDKGNVLLEWTLRANFKAGYWELRLLHTQPLGIVPENMRLPTRKPEKT